MGRLFRRDRGKAISAARPRVASCFEWSFAGLEALEERLVMDYSISFANDVLTVTSGAGDVSDLRVGYAIGNLALIENGTTAGSFQGSNLPTGVSINSGNQLIISDAFFSNPNRQVSVLLGDGADRVELLGFSGTRTGVTIDFGNDTVDDSLIGTADADVFTQLGDRSLSVGGVRFDRVDQVDGGGQPSNGGDRLVGTSGDDVFNILGSTELRSANVRYSNLEIVDGNGGTGDQVVGTTGNDTFTLVGPTTGFPNSTNIFASNMVFGNVERIDGGGGVDSVGGISTGAGANETITILGNNSIRVSGLDITRIRNFSGQGGTDTVVGTSGDDVIDLLSSGTSPSQAFRTAGIDFAAIEVFQAGGGTDEVRGLPSVDDSFTVTGANAGRAEGVLFEGIERFNSRSGPVTVDLDAGLVGTTSLDFTGLLNTPNVVSILGINIRDTQTIRTNGRPISLVGITTVPVVSFGTNDFRPVVNDISLQGVTTLAVDTVQGTAGNDAVTVTGPGTLTFRGITYTGVKQFEGLAGTDTVTIDVASASSPLSFSFALTDADNAIDNVFGINFRTIEAVDPLTRNVILGGPRLVTTTSTGTPRVLTANGISFSRVTEVEGVVTLQGTAGDDRVVMTQLDQITLNGTVFTNIGGFNGLAGNDRVVVDITPAPALTFDFPTTANNAVVALGVEWSNIESFDTRGEPVTITNATALARTGFRAFTANNIGFTNVQSATANGLAGTAGNDIFVLGIDGSVRFSQNPNDGDTLVTLINSRAILAGGGDDEAFGPASTDTERYQLSSVQGTPTVRAPGGFQLAGLDTIHSARANETLFGTSGDDQFVISGRDTLQISRTTTFPFSSTFVGFAELNGLEGNDQFIIGNDGSWSGNLVGGAGSDAIRSDDDGMIFTIRGTSGNRIESVVTSAPTIRQLGGTFAGIERLVGGTGVDEFRYQSTSFAGINVDGGSQPAGTISETNRGDVLDLSQALAGASINFDTGATLIGAFDSFLTQNVETVIGTRFDDRFLRTATSADTRVMIGGDGSDLFQIGNNSTDIVLYDGLDRLGTIDQNLDQLIPVSAGIAPPPVTVFTPATPPSGLNNIWRTLQEGETNGFINATNFPLVAEAYVRYLYQLLIGRDPDSVDGRRIVQFWTQRVASQSLTSYDLVAAFLTTNVANIGGPNPPAPQFFADYFFNGFAQREFGLPFAGRDTAALANLVKGGTPLEVAARQGGFLADANSLGRGWSRELLFNVLSRAEDASLRRDASKAFLPAAPSSTTFNFLASATVTFLQREQRSWFSTLQTIINSAEGMRSAVRTAAAQDPARFLSLFNQANLANVKLGSFEAQGWFLDNPPGRSREIIPNGINFGVPSDTPVAADWNGDGADDLGVFRSGSWFLDTNGTLGWQGTDTSVAFGVASDRPMPGDWNGDRRADLGVFRDGTWFLDTNGTLGWQGNDTVVQFGVAGDVPVVGDWNGDGVSDLGVRRGNVWYLDTNGVRGWQGNDTVFVDTFGPGEVVVADFNADGRDDIAVVNGNRWRIDIAGPFGFQPGTDVELTFDTNGGRPVVVASPVATLNRQLAASSAGTSSLLALSQPVLLPGSSTNSNSTTSSTSGVSNSNLPVSGFSSPTSVGQPTTPERSRPSFGSGAVVGLASREPVQFEEWLMADEADYSDAVDEILSEV